MVRAGFEPERTVAAVALLLIAALAAAAGGLAILVAPILGFAPPETQREAEASLLLTVVALWGFAIISTALAAFVIAGRHSRAALAVATALVVSAVIVMGPGREPATWLLLGVAVTNAGALLIGTFRHRRG
jgi:hypothetical protein